MSLYSELRDDIAEVLGDPDISTGEVVIRRVSGSTSGPNPWDPPVDVYQKIRLDAVVFTREAKFLNGTLVANRADVITAAGWATVIEENGLPVSQKIPLDVRDSDEIFVDGDVRQVVEKTRTPAAGPDVSVWSIVVED